MRKKMIAAALWCCAAGSHAQNSVELYGVVDAGISYTSNERTGQPGAYAGHSNFSLISGNRSGSRWGIRGSEDLGAGLKALFVLENGFDVAKGTLGQSGRLFGRQAFTGLASERLGSLTLGRQYTSLTDFVSPASPIPVIGGFGAHPGNIDDIDTTTRVDNEAKFASANYSGFQFGGSYGFGAQPGSLKRESAWSAGAAFVRGPLNLAAGYETSDNSKVGPSDPTLNTWDSTEDGTFGSSINEGFATAQSQQIVAAGATYDFGKAKAGVNYSNVQYRPGPFSLFTQEAIFNTVGLFAYWALHPSFHVFTGYSYTRSGQLDAADDHAQYHGVSLGLLYDLSRRTTLYTLAGYQRAIGKTLDSQGDIVDATASVGSKGIGHSAATASQVIVRVGIRQRF
ncbi:porin [Paraburkholderia aromaticivorans]|uniref:porin n=1 Tax=Paraburkholderia aromaticivorans TaxID=2026199 RepID=UPI0014560531|nr:porin [Paraburkholderia aromaticivorans]